jgi:serine/threonine-protein kinase ULK/ATG1
MAPEVLNREQYGFEADIYSLGVVLYCMLYGKYPVDS